MNWSALAATWMVLGVCLSGLFERVESLALFLASWVLGGIFVFARVRKWRL